jgi:uncharacterized membrane protein YkgB
MRFDFTKLLGWAARMDTLAVNVLRAALIVVLVWIGALKFAAYEADGIVPFVANSPFMKFFYGHPAPDYLRHMNQEGQLIAENRAWHEANHTYSFAIGLGLVIITLGILVAAHWWRPAIGALGSFLVVGMSFVTLSFLVTTPEAWVPNLGDAHHGFPYLSGRGRLVVKDVIMLGAALVTMADSAKTYLAKVAAERARASETGERAHGL